MINILVINETKAQPLTSAQIQAWLPAFQTQLNDHLRPAWGTDTVAFAFSDAPSPTNVDKDAWWLVFLDDSDQAGALAYHDVTPWGKPLSKVFVRTLTADHASVTVGATHELCEMLVDPWINGASQDPKGRFWATEVADPVESDSYGYKIGTTLVTDFVTPDWFAHKFADADVDRGGHAKSAFQVLSGGYAQYFDPHKGWQQVTGERAEAQAHSRPAVGSRRERRARGRDAWKRSEPKWML